MCIDQLVRVLLLFVRLIVAEIWSWVIARGNGFELFASPGVSPASPAIIDWLIIGDTTVALAYFTIGMN